MLALTAALWEGVGWSDASKHHQGVKAAVYLAICDLCDLMPHIAVVVYGLTG